MAIPMGHINHGSYISRVVQYNCTLHYPECPGSNERYVALVHLSPTYPVIEKVGHLIVALTVPSLMLYSGVLRAICEVQMVY